ACSRCTRFTNRRERPYFLFRAENTSLHLFLRCRRLWRLLLRLSVPTPSRRLNHEYVAGGHFRFVRAGQCLAAAVGALDPLLAALTRFATRKTGWRRGAHVGQDGGGHG